MSAGPVSRAAGALGLAALIPTSYQLAMGTLSPLDAAVRAGATFLAVLMVGRFVRWWLAAIATSFERAGVDASREAADAPRRRKNDRPPDDPGVVPPATPTPTDGEEAA